MSGVSEEVLTFWFGEFGQFVAPEKVGFWFKKSDETDRRILDRFGTHVQQALAGELDFWADEPRGRLALIILLDQFTRNIFRGTPRAFSGDVVAVSLALEAIAEGWDSALRPHERFFLYMPLEHQEDIHLQDFCVQLMESLAEEVDGERSDEFAELVRYAHAHRDVIADFGRFPHRNEILNRPTTVAEAEYLAQPGAGF